MANWLTSPHDRAIAWLAVPALATLAADPLASLVDTAIVARLGTAELGALGVNAGVFGFAFVIFNFLAYGTTPEIATEVAQKRLDVAGRLAVASLAIAVVVGLMGTALLVGLASPIASVMGAQGELVEPTLTYLQIRALAAPAVLCITAGNGVFRGYSDTTTPLFITLALAATNLVLDVVFVLGFGWGIAGAAWATVAAQYAGAGLFWGLLLTRGRGWFGIRPVLPTVGAVARLLGVGSVMSIRTIALVGTLAVGTSLAARMGTVTIAAHQIASQLWLLFALFIDALALAGQILVAKHIGEHHPGIARAVSNRLLVLGALFGVLFAVFVWAGQPIWPWLFDLESEVVASLAAVLPIVALMQPLNAAVFVGDGVFMGARAFGWLALVMVATAVTTCAAFAMVWLGGWGLTGLWWAMVVLIAVRAVGLSVRYWGPWAILRADGDVPAGGAR